jgi:hypothetical protein
VTHEIVRIGPQASPVVFRQRAVSSSTAVELQQVMQAGLRTGCALGEQLAECPGRQVQPGLRTFEAGCLTPISIVFLADFEGFPVYVPITLSREFALKLDVTWTA